ncbi:MAG TPA: hypothetical protein VH593_19900, partial [Ktedonobacteraceae bacterium]
DSEVIILLRRAERLLESRAPHRDDRDDHASLRHDREGAQHEVIIPAGNVMLEGTLNVPRNAKGIVLFVHGSGSSRHSPRNRYVAEVLQAKGLATLLFDLLTSEENLIDRRTSELRFNIALLTKRLIEVTRWVTQNAETRNLAVGYFSASTGAAAALIAAARLPDVVTTVVSRGGRPDLASEELGSVHASTLLIVGGLDEFVIGLNRQALAQLKCRSKQLVLVPGATHLFEEPGTLEQVARVATEWLVHYLSPATLEKGSTVLSGAEGTRS